MPKVFKLSSFSDSTYISYQIVILISFQTFDTFFDKFQMEILFPRKNVIEVNFLSEKSRFFENKD